MRVFFAIEFEEVIKEHIYDQLIKIKKRRSEKGNFSRKENIHLTLKFIGEVNPQDIKGLSETLQKSVGDKQSFTLKMNRVGQFFKGNKSIIWIGVESSDELKSLHGVLEENLFKLGYEKEMRDYTPHITIGRQVVLRDKKDNLDIHVDKEVDVKKISLMESTRINGVLTYRPITSVYLK